VRGHLAVRRSPTPSPPTPSPHHPTISGNRIGDRASLTVSRDRGAGTVGADRGGDVQEDVGEDGWLHQHGLGRAAFRARSRPGAIFLTSHLIRGAARTRERINWLTGHQGHDGGEIWISSLPLLNASRICVRASVLTEIPANRWGGMGGPRTADRAQRGRGPEGPPRASRREWVGASAPTPRLSRDRNPPMPSVTEVSRSGFIHIQQLRQNSFKYCWHRHG
jgi:hypothetical protein